MSVQSPSPPRMNVAEFLVWAEGRPGHYDLVAGEVLAQASERAAHWRTKFAIQRVMFDAVRDRSLPCHVVPDGATVVIDADTAYEPDAVIYCGPEVDPSSLVVENPVVVVEVLSPFTGRNDVLHKLAGYFRLPSVRHYLIVYPDQPLVLHHERRDDGTIVTRIVREGLVTLDAPGLAFALTDLYATGA